MTEKAKKPVKTGRKPLGKSGRTRQFPISLDDARRKLYAKKAAAAGFSSIAAWLRDLGDRA